MFPDGYHFVNYPNKDIKQFHPNGNIVTFCAKQKSVAFEYAYDQYKVIKYKDRIEQIFYTTQIKLV